MEDPYRGVQRHPRHRQETATPSHPGTRYSYSNYGYFLAGAIVAAASGEPYWDYMPRRLVLSNYYLAPGMGAFLKQQDRIITGQKS